MGEKEKRRGLPKHVAIILDGNRRWAQKRGLGTSDGHKAGARRVIENAKDCFAMGINTVFFFFVHYKHCLTLCFLYWKLEKTPGVIPKNMKDWSFLENFKIYLYPFRFSDFFFFHQDEVDYWMVIFCQDDDTSSPQVSQHVIVDRFFIFIFEFIHIERSLLYNGCKRLFLILLWSVIQC